MVFNTYHHIRMHLDQKMELDEKKCEFSFSLPISLRISLRRFLEANFQLKSCYLSWSNHHDHKLKIAHMDDLKHFSL